jgi:hypothetical protein
MVESPEEYKKRILGYQAGKDPLALQASTPRALEKLVRGVSPAALKKPPSPGKWSVAEIVAHLADDELVAAFRIRMVLESPGISLQAMDQNVWADKGQYALRNVAGSLELFRVLRQANLTLLRSLAPADWKLYGVHEERGVETIKDIAEHYAGHDLNHLEQVQRILSMRATRKRSTRARRSPARRRQ